jgi:hypothetical protein
MEHLNWSPSEKRLARALFENAAEAELAELIQKFKTRAAAVQMAEEMWAVREYLKEAQREFESKYDYRYSELIMVFGRLVREGRISESQLEGLSQEKRDVILRMATL